VIKRGGKTKAKDPEARLVAVRSKIKKAAAKANLPEIQLETIRGSEVVTIIDGKPKTERLLIREPIAERGHWDDPTDVNERSKSPRQQHGYRRADPIATLHARQPLKVTRRHVRVCERLRDDSEISSGARPGDGLGGLNGSSSSDGPTAAACMATESLRRAKAAVGPSLWKIVDSIVLSGVSIKVYSTNRRITEHNTKGYLMAALDALVDFYEPPIRGGSITSKRTKVKETC
jgi:hypothetical protein